MLKYSRSTGNCYLFGIHPLIPKDAIDITEERFQATLGSPQPGKMISHDADGLPILTDVPPPTQEELEMIERAWRDRQLADTDGLVTRHRDELEEQSDTTLTPDQYTELQTYRRALRLWPENEGFPMAELRPVAPPWVDIEHGPL